MRRFLLTFAACLVAAVLLASPASAATIVYTTLGSGGSYNCCSGWTISGPGSDVGATYWVGAQFTATWNSPITQIDLATGYLSGGNSFNIYLLTDSGGSPGSIMDAWLGWPAADSFGNCCALSTVTGNIPVTPGQSYWLEVQAASGDLSGTWNENNRGLTGNMYSGSGAVFTDTLPAYQIWAGEVPEPSSLLLVLPGVAALLMLRRRRR